MIGEIQNWNPNADFEMVGQWVNNAARKVYDRRLWYGLMTRGQIVSPGFYSVGSASLVLGSNIVHGTNTTWLSGLPAGQTLVGRQFRLGYNNPIFNILSVQSDTQLTVDLPWASPTIGPTGYYIAQYYYQIPNIKYIWQAINLQLQMRMITNLTQNTLNTVDPSRQQLMYSWAIASMPPAPNGDYQFELYPASMIAQAFPYTAYVQPPNLVNDLDTLPPAIRCDIVKAHAIADVLRYRTKDNPNYSEAVALQIAKEKIQEFEFEIQRAGEMDENLNRMDYVADYENFPIYNPGGAFWNVIHAVGSDGSGEW
jgi:hypothetical protein